MHTCGRLPRLPKRSEAPQRFSVEQPDGWPLAYPQDFLIVFRNVSQ